MLVKYRLVDLFGETAIPAHALKKVNVGCKSIDLT